MISKVQLLLDKFESLYNRAIGLDTPRSFFLTLYEFVAECDASPLLEPISKVIHDLADKDNEYLKGLETKALEEMDAVYKEISDYVEKNKITWPVIVENLDHYRAYGENRINSSSGPIAGRHGSLLYTLVCLMGPENKQNREFVNKFGDLDSEGRILHWSISQSFDLWDEEQKRLDRIKLTKVWYSWDKIVFFYQIYKDFEKIRGEKIKNREYFTAMGLSDLFQELNDVMDYKKDTKRYLREFDVGVYKIHLQRVYLFIRELLVQANESQDSVMGSNQSYDPKSAISDILATHRFSKQEKSFIKKLSDLKPHEISEIEAFSKDPSHLSSRTEKKLGDTMFKVKSQKGNGVTQSYYQLVQR